MNTFTATASNGRTISRNTKLTFTYCIVYVNGQNCASPAWASDAVKAQRVAASMRNVAAWKGTMVAGFSVEIIPAMPG